MRNIEKIDVSAMEKKSSTILLKQIFFAMLFASGNVVIPALLHIFAGDQYGRMFLPLFFFTLIAGYRFGFLGGLAVAILSPLASFAITGMPVLGALPLILIKSAALAITAATAARLFGKHLFAGVLTAVLAAQLLSGVSQALIMLSIAHAVQTVVAAMPGILLQIFGGYMILKLMEWYAHKTNS